MYGDILGTEKLSNLANVTQPRRGKDKDRCLEQAYLWELSVSVIYGKRWILEVALLSPAFSSGWRRTHRQLSPALNMVGSSPAPSPWPAEPSTLTWPLSSKHISCLSPWLGRPPHTLTFFSYANTPSSFLPQGLCTCDCSP